MNSVSRTKSVKSFKADFDVIIIGGGAAGMSAALWCDDLGLKSLLLEASAKLGGQLHRVYNPIENHLGAIAENGAELNEKFLRQLKNRKFVLLKNAKVAALNCETKTAILKDGASFSARAIVIAAGISRRKLNVEGEEKFSGKGILESGKRDAEKVKGKIVCIIGGGDAALENVEILSATASKIYLIHRRAKFTARKEFVEKARKNPKVEIFTETIVSKMSGRQKLEKLELVSTSNNKFFELKTDALLIRIGSAPNTEFLNHQIKLDKSGYIKINSNCETSQKQIFAIGDIAAPISPTVSTAVGMGATATKFLLERLKKS